MDEEDNLHIDREKYFFFQSKRQKAKFVRAGPQQVNNISNGNNSH